MAFLGSSTGTDGLPKIMFTTSINWQPTVTYEAMVYVIGGGGGGAYCGNNATSNAVTGGSAGGVAISRLMLNSGSTYVVTVGDGGGTTGGTGCAGGADGEDTTFVCAAESISITGGNGEGGNVGTSSTAGPSGGAGSGHNIISFTGGTSLEAAVNKVTGGGAVGLFSAGLAGTKLADATAWEEKAVADGGTLHGNQGGGSYGETDLDYAYHSSVQQPPIAMSPFGEITTSLSGKTQSTLTANQINTIPANTQMFTTGGKDYFRSSSYKQIWPSGPFAGGNGFYNTESGRTYCTAGFGTLGGGGGGCFNGISSGEALGGRGGTGAVLIFPLSMG